MNRYFRILLILPILIVLLLVPLVTAQDSDDGCPVDVRSVLQRSEDICDGIGRNQACYGNFLVNAEAQPRLEEFYFDQPGDNESIANIRSLYLSAMNPVDETWGIAYMRLSILTSSLEIGDINMVLFGDSEVENLAKDRKTLNASVSVSTYINVRQYPSENAGAVAVLAPREAVLVIGRITGNSWLRITSEATGIIGWVHASLLSVDGDIDTLLLEAVDEPYYRPMQAFLYSNGDDGRCGSAPIAGLVVQTPEGQARVTFLINEVSIDIASEQTGSAAFIQSAGEGEFFLAMLEGTADVTVDDITTTVIAGSQITVDEDGVVVAPLDETLAEGLASLGATEGEIEPATEAEIAAANATPTPEESADTVNGTPATGSSGDEEPSSTTTVIDVSTPDPGVCTNRCGEGVQTACAADPNLPQCK